MAVSFRPEQFHGVTVILSVKDSRAQLDFLRKAFDAEVLYKMEGEDGVVHHAEVRLLDTTIMVGQPEDESAIQPSTLYLYVEDCDELYQKAIDAGATSIRAPEDLFYGDRSGMVTDSNGNTWWIATHIEDVSDEEMRRRMAEMNPS